jgi:hypothetical protein
VKLRGLNKEERSKKHAYLELRAIKTEKIILLKTVNSITPEYHQNLILRFNRLIFRKITKEVALYSG